jgi:glutamate-1-semialdehyde 2,1-aminomutase
LSAAAGITTLQLVADGEPGRRANAAARQLRQHLNALLARRGDPWVAYGEFSGFRLLPNYQGPRPDGDDFIPYGGALDKLDGASDRRVAHAFRQGMLLHGVDLPGLAGMTTAAHTEADVEQTIDAVAGTLDMLRAEGLT